MKFKLSKFEVLPGSLFAITLSVLLANAASDNHMELQIFKKFMKKSNSNIEQITDVQTINNHDSEKMAIAFNDKGVIFKQPPTTNNQPEYEVTDLSDEDIEQEEIDDLISEYIVSLQVINENNPLEGIDTEDFILNHYDELFYDTNDFSKIKKQYAALAYQRLIDNDVDVMKAFDELHMIMLLQLEPTDMDEDEYTKIFSELSKTLNEYENVYDVYFPLAKQIHIVSCKDDHFIEADTGITYCDSLKEEIKENSYTK